MRIALLTKKLTYSVGIAFCFLTGCSIGPRYVPPTAVVPSTWSHPSNQTSLTPEKYAWWRYFHDPLLNELIEQHAGANLNVKIAEARVEAARADYAIAYAQLFPTLSAALWPPSGTGFDLTQILALSATVQPDFFGKRRENRHQASATLEAEQASREGALLNLQADIASSYLELREAQSKDKILRHNIEGNRQVFSFIKSRYSSGLTNYMNIAQQDALIATQLAELEQNRALITMIVHKLEILTGHNPGGLAKQLSTYKPVPQITHKINLGIPSELLRRRPDIIAAERRVAAAHANIRVSMANLFPDVTLGWLLAWQTQSLASNIFAMKNSESSYFGTFNTPLLNLTLYRIIDLRKREKGLAVIQYQMTVMHALHDVETQFDYCKHYKASAAHFNHAVEQKKLVLKLAKDTYQKGASNFNTVLRSEEDLNRLELSHLHTLVGLQIAQINLYKALGGGVCT